MALAIECGASNSVAVYVNKDQIEIQFEKTARYHFGPANFKLFKPLELETFFKNVHDTVQEKNVTALAVAMPGILTSVDRKQLKNVLSKVWTKLDRIWVGNDLESSMARLPVKDYLIQCVAISGTGSCCFGTDGKRSRKIGGWGHVIGDRGSGYSIAYRALRLALRDFEHNYDDTEAYSNDPNGSGQQVEHFDIETTASSTSLLKLILANLNMTAIYDLVNWSLVASKHEMADLARVVIRAAQSGNKIAREVIEEATTAIVNDLICLVSKLRAGKDIADERICLGFTGSLFTKSPFFTERTIAKIREKGCFADVTLVTDTVLGALRKIIDPTKQQMSVLKVDGEETKAENENDTTLSGPLREKILPLPTGLAETEKRNLRSMNLSSMPLAEAVELMIDEESRSNRSLREHVSSLVLLIEKVTSAFRSGGRLFYVGAGTSGRLGILDASECPPTFKAPQHWVQGIIAGGNQAIQSSVEGAEDSIEDGIASIIDKDVCDKDVVLGIAASGRTPFVWGALYESLRRSAFSALLTFNSNLNLQLKLDLVIMVNSGPEVLTGSTRLKAGTATKCFLNVLTTLSMVSYGKCLENLMVDMMPVNEKLRERALRITLMIVEDPTVSKSEAEAALIKNNYDIKQTVAELRYAGQH